MIQIDMEMPKNCKECPMNYEGLDCNMCACIYYQIKDMERLEKQLIMEKYKTPSTARPTRPIWCPLKEVEDGI